MPSSANLRLIGHGRVSTDDQAEYGFGLDTQRVENTAYAAQIGAELVGYEEDPGISGTIYPRPGLERALKRIEAGEADGLLAHRVDRIGRKLWIPPVVYERLAAVGARLLTVQDGEVTESNILMFSLRCGLAQNDYQQIISNMKAGKRRLVESGLGLNRSTPPYGYHVRQKIERGIVQHDPGTYHIIEEQAVVVRQAFASYGAGLSLVQICKLFQQQGTATPRPPKVRITGVWQPATLRRILCNPVYRGTSSWGDVQIAVPAIVDPGMWERCQELREENKSACWRRDRAHLLSGLLVCPTCGKRMKVRLGGVSSFGRYVAYRCAPTGGPNDPARPCRMVCHSERIVAAALVAVLTRISADPAFAAAAYAQYAGQEGEEGLVDQLQQAQVKLTHLHQREEATIKGQITALQTGARTEVYDRLLREIAVERAETEKRIAALAIASAHRRQVGSIDMGKVASTVAAELLEVVQAEELSEVVKNGLLRRLVQSIVPVEGGYEVRMRPFLTGQDAVPVTSVSIAVTGTTMSARFVTV
jgi:site-specific DNA recombinase